MFVLSLLVSNVIESFFIISVEILPRNKIKVQSIDSAVTDNGELEKIYPHSDN